MTDTVNSLAELLKARRRTVEPSNVGLRVSGRRQVPGLRREELAALAGVSAPYYTRLEQGRDCHPSPQILEALGKVLDFDDATLAYARRLAAPVPPRRQRPQQPEEMAVGLAGVLSSWSAQPAFVMGPRGDVVSANALATALNVAFAPGRNLVRVLFLEPVAKRIYRDWPTVASDAVAGLRTASDHEADDPGLREFVAELSAASEEFRDLWSRHEVRERSFGIKRFNNELVGPLTLTFQHFHIGGTDGHTLVVYFGRPRSRDERLLADLSSISAARPSSWPPAPADDA